MYYNDNLKMRIVEIVVGNKMGRQSKKWTSSSIEFRLHSVHLHSETGAIGLVHRPISIIRLWSEIRNLVNYCLSLALQMLVKYISGSWKSDLISPYILNLLPPNGVRPPSLLMVHILN